MSAKKTKAIKAVRMWGHKNPEFSAEVSRFRSPSSGLVRPLKIIDVSDEAALIEQCAKTLAEFHGSKNYKGMADSAIEECRDCSCAFLVSLGIIAPKKGRK